MNKKDYILKETFRLLNERYPLGLYEFLYKHHSELFKRLQNIEEEIDRAYLTGTVDELKLALREYWSFHLHAIKIFRKSGQLGLDVVKVREEISENRATS